MGYLVSDMRDRREAGLRGAGSLEEGLGGCGQGSGGLGLDLDL